MFDGNFFAILGAAVAFFLAGAGSAKGVSIAGEAASGVVAEDSDKFVSVMILEALPSTQGIYGFVIAFMIMAKMTDLGTALTTGQGIALLIAGLPIGIVGLFSAVYQGRVAAASIGIIAKRSSDMVKGIILTLMVELFAIFAILISILMIGRVG
ncbi:MAG: V-type ATP synthase subunit K [Clostridia bacterium]|nr:V-type ATP synthase subunit K [Clostridia bacterium]MBN2882121.1 V-type ATP synthase subunit K [Clostridia bacterium]